jgi:hypothetical protein
VISVIVTWENETESACGGQMISGAVGCDVYFGKFALGNDFRLPLFTDLSEGMPADQLVCIVSISYNF